ncbi:gas vesicle protein GvpG [Stenomitos frigidus]|uniref:Gas vesicle protein GvpG n=1 Tax=Stenomitos frigidus ULC18 TaxID=2107698 RepID=A0A2T1E356_9CYAN|nr:gas vesicle protein GvpG [Stenomitos frigidus]PSB27165.1 gas vesicle protein GvpG [Stenomitos frigidus ULC18]
MLFKLLFAPVTGLGWIAEQIQQRADTELDATENLSKRLLALQLAFDMGDIPENEFEVQEEELLVAIQALEDRKRAEAALEAVAEMD